MTDTLTIEDTANRMLTRNNPKNNNLSAMKAAIDRQQLEQLASSIASLRLGKYSDFQIRCKDDSIIKAHRSVVCTRSRVIAAAMDGNFPEAGLQEYHMSDDEPSIVGKMIDYLYTLDYDDRPSSSMVAEEAKQQQQARATDQAPSLLINAKVYIIADKYELEALKWFACSKYKKVLWNTWNTPFFPESACHVLENTMETDRLLRDVIVRVASEHAKDLLDRDEFVEMLRNHGDIAADILRKVVKGCDQPALEQRGAGLDYGASLVQQESLMIDFYILQTT